MLHAVIMAGGSGTRFWPESRRERPKQFLRLAGERSLLQATLDRCRPLIPPERVWVVTNAVQAEQTREQLPELPAANILAEPRARNTAPCVGLAAIHLLARDPAAVMVLLPADHVITPGEAFRDALSTAADAVARDPQRLMLFGVRPTSPATGYGYIERGAPLGDNSGAYEVAAFREKPDRATAEEYVRRGTFYWNCGIFVWRAARILDALAAHEPEMHASLLRLRPAIGTAAWDAAVGREYPRMKSTSIDYAVLERDRGIGVIEAPFAWDDVGSWLAMARLHGQDAAGNTVIGLHRGVETRDCIIRTSENHLVATLGLDNCIVVHTSDATLVARTDDENAIKKLVELLQERGDTQYL